MVKEIIAAVKEDGLNQGAEARGEFYTYTLYIHTHNLSLFKAMSLLTFVRSVNSQTSKALSI